MIRKILMNLVVAALFGIAALMLVPAAMGLHRYVILTGSMTGTYDPGSIVFDKPVKTSSLKVGDPITYAPPPGASPNQDLVTHRILKVSTTPKGQRVYKTKGDANEKPDLWHFSLPKATQDKVIWHIPYAGYIFMVLGVPQFRMALIGGPAVLMALWMVVGMWRDAGAVVRGRERAPGWTADSASRVPDLAPARPGELRVRGAGAVALPVTWGAPAARRRGRPPITRDSQPPCARQRDRAAGRVRLPVASRPRGRRQRLEAPIVLPARLRTQAPA